MYRRWWPFWSLQAAFIILADIRELRSADTLSSCNTIGISLDPKNSRNLAISSFRKSSIERTIHGNCWVCRRFSETYTIVAQSMNIDRSITMDSVDFQTVGKNLQWTIQSLRKVVHISYEYLRLKRKSSYNVNICIFVNICNLLRNFDLWASKNIVIPMFRQRQQNSTRWCVKHAKRRFPLWRYARRERRLMRSLPSPTKKSGDRAISSLYPPPNAHLLTHDVPSLLPSIHQYFQVHRPSFLHICKKPYFSRRQLAKRNSRIIPTAVFWES